VFRVFPKALDPCFAFCALSHSSLCNMYHWTAGLAFCCLGPVWLWSFSGYKMDFQTLCSLIFPVEIVGKKTVRALKDAIKDQGRPPFDHIPTYNLILWKVSIPVDERLEENVTNGPHEQLLFPLDKLSTVFTDVPSLHLHIIVNAPCRG